MYKTLRISFALRNTYRVNAILYALKQIPFLKKLLPVTLYRSRGLKAFGQTVSVLWEIVSAFLGKLLFFLILIAWPMRQYPAVPQDQLFLHLFLFLSAIGAFLNTYMFNPTKDAYYAVVLLRMDGRRYTLVHYFYAILKLLAAYCVFTALFGTTAGLPLGLCLLLPFFAAGIKLSVCALSLWTYEKGYAAFDSTTFTHVRRVIALLFLGAAYGLPAAGVLLPRTACILVMSVFIALGALSLKKILSFGKYRQIFRQLLIRTNRQLGSKQQFVIDRSHTLISADTGITSHRKGFAYLNELFMKRHKKILWRSSKRTTLVCAVLLAGVLAAFSFRPDFMKVVNELLLSFLPYFVFIMYAINRGTRFTQALFINCDHSLLTYSFYKQPKAILSLFRIRLKEIVKVNLLPAAVIGCGLAILLYASGGTDNLLHYAVLVVSILCMSIFFSVHYLTIYYLFQPYNAGTEMRSGTYRLVLIATYLVCFFLMRLQMPTLLFGLMSIAFCILYCIAAAVLVYTLAPRTFRLRN